MATTPGGKTLSAQQVKPLILYQPLPTERLLMGEGWDHKIGFFLLSVRSDGTVANVEILQSIGRRNMDIVWVWALKKWRFRPNSVKQVRVPGDYR